jgi:ABC-type Mn2+/Zn2+ transport system ATPase subunit
MFALRIFFPIRNAVLNSFYQWQTNHARAVGLASRMRNAINSAFNHKSMHTLLDESVFSLNRAEAKLFFMVSLPAIVALGVAGMLLGIGTVVFSRGYLMQHLVEIALLLRLVPVAFSAHTFSRGNFSHANLASEFFNFLSVADRAKYDAPVVRNDLLKKLVAQVQAHNTVWIAGPSGIGKSLCLSELAAHYSDNQIDYFFQNQITINDGASLGYLLTWEVERDFYSWEDVARVGEKFQIDKNICFAMADGDVDPLSSASGGELQRLWLVRALLSGKKLLLLDEPLSGVNSDVQQKIWEEFRQCSPGVKIVCISHSDLSSVFESRFTIDREGDVLTGVGERLFC